MDFITKDSFAWFADFFVQAGQDLLVDAEVWDSVYEFYDAHLLQGPLDVFFRHCCLLDYILQGETLALMSSNIVD